MILLTASFGGMSYLSFNNGILLSYFSHLGIPSATILILLSILPLTTFLVIIPFSYFSDIFGKKRIGIIGMVFSFFGFALLIGVSYLPDSLRIMAVGFGIVVFGIGSAMTLGNWFALLHPIIPENIRGRFFGQLRLTWQSIGILFTLIVIYILELYPTLEMYQAILGIITILMLLRMFFYQQIPELDKSPVKKESFRISCLKVLNIPGYLPFCAYCFLLTLFTGACPQIFNLIEKDVLLWSKRSISRILFRWQNDRSFWYKVCVSLLPFWLWNHSSSFFMAQSVYGRNPDCCWNFNDSVWNGSSCIQYSNDLRNTCPHSSEKQIPCYRTLVYAL